MKTMRDIDAVPGRSGTEPAASGFEREQVRKWLQGQRKFRSDLAAYLVINAALVVVWLFTGAGYFWPGWVLGAWGVLLLLDFRRAYLVRPITDPRLQHDTGLHNRRRLTDALITYVVIAAALVVVWLVTGAGYFWPGWIIAPWGLLIVLDLWETYLRKPLTDSDIDERLRRTHR
jgi:hypothetical protein